MKRINIKHAERFNRLSFNKEIPSNNSNRRGEFICDCGNLVEAAISDVRNGHTKSCGCHSREMAAKRQYKHGLAKTKFYNVYSALKARCRNSFNKDYKDWGGRGILCLWDDFEHFKNDMYKSYLAHQKKYQGLGTTIDRINNDGDYCKENCRWATHKQQAQNRRKRTQQKRDIKNCKFIK